MITRRQEQKNQEQSREQEKKIAGQYHVIRGDERVVDSDQFDILALEGEWATWPGHEPSAPSETCAKFQSPKPKPNPKPIE